MSPSLAEEVIPQSDGSVIIEGGASIRELNKAFNWSLPEEEARTINDMLLEDIPLANTHTHIGSYQIDILAVQDNMIKQVRITPIKPLKQGVDGN